MKWRETYTQGALLFLNSLLFLAVVNAGLGIWYWHADRKAAALLNRPHRYVEDFESHFNVPFETIYPGRSRDEIDRLLQETWSRTLQYAPYTEFREKPQSGTFVNISPDGFRLSGEQGPWPPDPKNLNVFVFGGSTTFGYGVSDNETIPSYLQEALSEIITDRPVRVYNFGHGYYYSTQERILFEQLLTAGHMPHLVIFIDGLNEIGAITDKPFFHERFEELMNGTPAAPSSCLSRLPLARLARSLRERCAKKPTEEDIMRQHPLYNVVLTHDTESKSLATSIGRIQTLIGRYLGNKRIIEGICREYGIKAAFVWQPVPTYEYDLHYYAFSPAGFGSVLLTTVTYPAMKELYAANRIGEQVIWAADLQKGAADNLYVDMTHYNPALSKRIAAYIVMEIVRQRIL